MGRRIDNSTPLNGAGTSRETPNSDKNAKRKLALCEMVGGGGNGYAMPAAVLKKYNPNEDTTKKAR
jgi:hypothetical protein